MNAKNINRLEDTQIKELKNRKVAHYELIEPDADTWNRKALKSNREQFVRIQGYEPINDAEVIRWARGLSNKSKCAVNA